MHLLAFYSSQDDNINMYLIEMQVTLKQRKVSHGQTTVT
jgi:hypothetical protein